MKTTDKKKSHRGTYVAIINFILVVVIAVLLVLAVKGRYESEVVATEASRRAEVAASILSMPEPTVYDDTKYIPPEHPDPPETSELEAESTPEPTEQPTQYIYLSESEIYEFATLVFLEAGCESYECKKAVASVVVNRMTTRGMDLRSVIYETNQFSPASVISQYSPTQDSLNAVMEVITYGPTIPMYVTFFRADYYFDWLVPYMSIDHTYFSYDYSLKTRLGM